MRQLHIKQPLMLPSNNHTLIQRLWFIKPVLKLWAGLALSKWMTQTTTAEGTQEPTKSHGDKPDWKLSGFLKKRLCCICESGLQGGIQYLNSSVLHHTDTYIHIKSQGTFKTQNTTCIHTASCVILCPAVSTEAELMHQNGKYQTQCFNVIGQKQSLLLMKWAVPW